MTTILLLSLCVLSASLVGIRLTIKNMRLRRLLLRAYTLPLNSTQADKIRLDIDIYKELGGQKKRKV